MTTRIKVTGHTASEMDLIHESAEQGDDHYRLAVAWTGSSVEVYDTAHAHDLASIACNLSNDFDRDLDAGRYDDCATTKRQHRAIMVGLSNLSAKLYQVTA